MVFMYVYVKKENHISEHKIHHKINKDNQQYRLCKIKKKKKLQI